MTGDERQALEAMLQAAAWGVSADNGQPWIFHWRESRLFVTIDQVRTESFFDQGKYAVYLALGSVLENLSIAAVHLGYDPTILLFPQHAVEGQEAVAALSFRPTTPTAHPLYESIEKRITNRRLYKSKVVPSEASKALLATVQGYEGFRLLLIESPALKAQLGTWTAEVDRIRFDFSLPEVHSDFFRHLRFSRQEAEKTRDGLWVDCLEVGMAVKLFLRWLSNPHFARAASWAGTNRLFAAQSAVLLRHTPLVSMVIYTSPSPAAPLPRALLDGGCICQRLWLTATVHGLACQPMAALPLFTVQHARYGSKGFPNNAAEVVQRLIENYRTTLGLTPQEFPLMVFRMGYAEAPSARSFRRNLSELFRIEDDSPFLASDTTP